jgi:hypothetical protein
MKGPVEDRRKRQRWQARMEARVGGTDLAGKWEEDCSTIDLAPDGCALLMRRRVELGNVLTLRLVLPKSFRLGHKHYPKPDSDGCRHFQVAVRNVSQEEAGLRVGVQFLTEAAPQAGMHRLGPAALVVATLAFALGVVGWGMARSRAEKATAQKPMGAEMLPARRTARSFTGSPGPWGQIEYTRIFIEPPDRYRPSLRPVAEAPTRWTFRAETVQGVSALLEQAGMPPTQVKDLLKQHAKSANGAVTVTPPDDVVLGLPEQVRTNIYRRLADFAENTWQDGPLLFYPELVSEQLELGGLTPKAEESIRRLFYHRGNWLMFSDPGTVLRQLPSEESKLRFVATLHRKATYVAALRIDGQTNLDAVEAYWQFKPRQHDLRPLLESLARIPGGASLDIIHLLPPFARRRLYRYPEPSEQPLDCHYSSLNFYQEIPDPRLADEGHQLEVFRDQYALVDQPQFGDVVTLGAPGEATGSVTLVHSAVYLADNLVFTKNGSAPSQPWMLMRLDSMVDRYQTLGAWERPLKLAFYRKRR